jgi:hypothetical protein
MTPPAAASVEASVKHHQADVVDPDPGPAGRLGVAADGQDMRGRSGSG